MAEAHKEKFSLIRSDADVTEFEYADSDLDFVSVSPTNFIWNPSVTVPPELISAAMFSGFQERTIGYDPLNRDRFEIRLYTGRIFPDRVAVATDYGRLFGRVWTKKNFGVMAHNRDFGEVLGGDDSSGIMIVNRITVMRRGDELLVIRSKFHAEHFETYAKAMAEFIGSLQFTTPQASDSIVDTFAFVQQSVAPDLPMITYGVPGNWTRLDTPAPNAMGGDLQVWIDSADPNRNGGALFATVPPQSAVPDGETITPVPQDMANLAGSFANVALENLLPGQAFRLEPLSMNDFEGFKPVTAFNALYVFKVTIGENQAKISVLIAMGPDGSLTSSTTLSPAPLDLYLTGTGMHVNFVQGQALDTMRAYWTAQTEDRAK
jgi:hypothetical protein